MAIIRLSKIKEILAASTGTMLQWYDFSLFGLLTPIIANNFFPADDQILSILKTFTVFAVGFLLGPIGSLFFGFIGDRKGRKVALTWSILLMAIPTLTIALLPTYKEIGIWAPIILIGARLIQGFVVSAEFASSAIFLVEHAPNNRKVLYGSFISISYSLGFIIGTVVTSLVTLEWLPSWFWRVPFIFSVIGIFLLSYIRSQVSESPHFDDRKQKNFRNLPIKHALKEAKLPIICTMVLAGFAGIITYGSYTYMITYMYVYAHISMSKAALIVMIGLIVDVLFEPFFANLADKKGDIKLINVGILLLLISSPLIFYLITLGNIFITAISFIYLSILIAIIYAPVHAFLVSLFPPSYRCSGYSFAYNIGVTLCGGTAPMVLTWMIYETDNIFMPAYYYMLSGLCAFIIINLTSNRKIIEPIHATQH